MFIRSAVILSGVLLGSTLAFADPMVKGGSASGKAGTVVELPISFDAGNKSVSGIQFVLTAPKGLSVQGVTGSAAVAAAGKSVSSKQSNRETLVIIFGLNQAAVPNGEIAKAKVSIDRTLSSGSQALSISKVICTDPKGNSISAQAPQDGKIVIP